jgi:hypothetical protein
MTDETPNVGTTILQDINNINNIVAIDWYYFKINWHRESIEWQGVKQYDVFRIPD